MRRFLPAVAAATLALALSACSSDGDNNETSPASTPVSSPDIAMTVKAAPDQDPNGTRPVGFDPCTGIGDETITKAGFDPKTRRRSDQIHTGYAFISCRFDHKEDVNGQLLTTRSVNISSTGITLDQFRQREASTATDIQIDGQPAVAYHDPSSEYCDVVTKGPDSSLVVEATSTGTFTDWNPCDHVQEIATVVASAVNSR
ncbi:DUF3558 domain-containing protein [Nocardia sp. NPDC052254]|uniref:DUF3558 domain-containing protein n=1 Tax=Nocardia sp. NPDC052254 TaxID=3155681 RepID=UPI00342554B0